MKTLMALVLSLGMVLLGTAPVMAAGQLMAPKAPANLSAPVKALKPDPSLTQPAIPEPLGFSEVSDVTLGSVAGDLMTTGVRDGGGGGGGIGPIASSLIACFICRTVDSVSKYVKKNYNNIKKWRAERRKGTRLIERKERERRAKARKRENEFINQYRQKYRSRYSW